MLGRYLTPLSVTGPHPCPTNSHLKKCGPTTLWAFSKSVFFACPYPLPFACPPTGEKSLPTRGWSVDKPGRWTGGGG